MAEQRLSRRDIRQPDQFVSLSVRLFAWAKAHVRLLGYIAVGCAVLIAVGSGWRVWSTHHAQAAESALYEAAKVLTGPSANRAQAFALLQKLVNDYGSTRASVAASWQLGHLYFEDASYAAALAAYQQAQKSLSKTQQPLMTALILLDVAYAQEASGACDPGALTSFEALLALPAPWLRGEAYSGMGRCHETAQAWPKALAVYERALADDKVPDTARQWLSERVLLLKERG